LAAVQATGGGILDSALEAVSVGSMYALGDFTSRVPSGGALSSVYVGGSVNDSVFEAGGRLSSPFALGDFTNSSAQAGSLSVVHVGGAIGEDSTDGDTDAIHAGEGRFFVRDENWAGWVDRDHDHWFDNVRAWVG